MKKFHPFYSIGTVGMILIAFLHILLASILTSNSLHTSFFIMYPVFLAFLILGLGLTIKKQKGYLGT